MTEYQTLQAALAGLPAGMVRWWVDEVLLRCSPDGGIAGAHVVIGVEMTDPMGGKTRVLKGPYPLDVLGDDFAALIGAVTLAQQATIAERDATIAQLTADLAAQQQTLDAEAATIAALTADLAAIQQLIHAVQPAEVVE